LPSPASTPLAAWFRGLRSLVALFGADLFVVRSDYPAGGPPHAFANVHKLELADAEQAAVLRDNATGLLEHGRAVARGGLTAKWLAARLVGAAPGPPAL
jgi:hypothetical protein